VKLTALGISGHVLTTPAAVPACLSSNENRDLGFTVEDRVENMRRVGEVAKLMADEGAYRAGFAHLAVCRGATNDRELIGAGAFFETVVDTTLEECKRPDPKGLYAKALRGEIGNFTGIDLAYEPPEAPELHLRTEGRTAEELALLVEQLLITRGIVEV